MNFVRYDPDTGALTCVGYMDVAHIEEEIANGEPTLRLPEPMYFSITQKRVDLATLTLVDV